MAVLGGSAANIHCGPGLRWCFLPLDRKSSLGTAKRSALHRRVPPFFGDFWVEYIRSHPSSSVAPVAAASREASAGSFPRRPTTSSVKYYISCSNMCLQDIFFFAPAQYSPSIYRPPGTPQKIRPKKGVSADISRWLRHAAFAVTAIRMLAVAAYY